MGLAYQRPGWRSLYNSKEWHTIRRLQLSVEPNCRACARTGTKRRATVVDHVERHNGDPEKFYRGPFQSLCKPHHDIWKQSFERTGKMRGADLEGNPVDPKHPWNLK